MTNASDYSNQQQKKCLVEQLWLHYFNATLFEKGLITETQRNRISNMISHRKIEATKIKKRIYPLEKKN